LEHWLHDAFVGKNVLFVGGGDTTSDPHFTQLFQFLQRINEHGKPRHVHLCADKDYLQLQGQMPPPVFLVPYGSHGTWLRH
jgi:hypothetical protein